MTTTNKLLDSWSDCNVGKTNAMKKSLFELETKLFHLPTTLKNRLEQFFLYDSMQMGYLNGAAENASRFFHSATPVVDLHGVLCDHHSATLVHQQQHEQVFLTEIISNNDVSHQNASVHTGSSTVLTKEQHGSSEFVSSIESESANISLSQPHFTTDHADKKGSKPATLHNDYDVLHNYDMYLKQQLKENENVSLFLGRYSSITSN
jgi:hypothetical protein